MTHSDPEVLQNKEFSGESEESAKGNTLCPLSFLFYRNVMGARQHYWALASAGGWVRTNCRGVSSQGKVGVYRGTGDYLGASCMAIGSAGQSSEKEVR